MDIQTKSVTTFREEYNLLSLVIPEGFWKRPESKDFFRFPREDIILLDFLDYLFQATNKGQVHEPIAVNNANHILTTEFTFDLFQLSENISEATFLANFQQQYGFDLKKALVHFKEQSSNYNLADLVTKIGRDAFGFYLPFHAYYNSPTTGWGIYLFLELIIEKAATLYKEQNQGLSLVQHFILYSLCVYRHELFHYQVERFATKIELMQHKPIYKPYCEKVEATVAYTEDWLEEALAEASVLTSRLVTHRSKVSLDKMRAIYEYDLQSMPSGYKDYHCKKYNGPELAFKVLSGQILTTKKDPSPFYLTDLFSVRQEYSSDDKEVPGYIVFSDGFRKQFQ